MEKISVTNAHGLFSATPAALDYAMRRYLPASIAELRATVLEVCGWDAHDVDSTSELLLVLADAQGVEQHECQSVTTADGRGAFCCLCGTTLAALLLAILLPLTAHAADKQANEHGGKQPRHVTHALSTITVKVVAQADFARKASKADHTATSDGKPAPWIITAADADSCTAWVSEHASEGAELAAFRACRRVIDSKVDAAHAAAERGTSKDGAR